MTSHSPPPSIPDPCPWCGDPLTAEIFEVWGHEFMLETCCEALHDQVSILLAGDPREAIDLIRDMNAEELIGHRLRGLISDGSQLLLDFRLRTAPIAFSRARSFVARHHAHCKPPAGWRFGLGCWNGLSLVGVSMVGRPVARMIDSTTTVEVNRLCLDRDLPHALRYNAASMLLGQSAREARRRGYSRIITYTLASESGASLKAAGWKEDGQTRGGSWSRTSRKRSDSGPTGVKTRWTRSL